MARSPTSSRRSFQGCPLTEPGERRRKLSRRGRRRSSDRRRGRRCSPWVARTSPPATRRQQGGRELMSAAPASDSAVMATEEGAPHGPVGWAAMNPGDLAPHFELPAEDGQRIRLSDDLTEPRRALLLYAGVDEPDARLRAVTSAISWPISRGLLLAPWVSAPIPRAPAAFHGEAQFRLPPALRC